MKSLGKHGSKILLFLGCGHPTLRRAYTHHLDGIFLVSIMFADDFGCRLLVVNTHILLKNRSRAKYFPLCNAQENALSKVRLPLLQTLLLRLEEAVEGAAASVILSDVIGIGSLGL